jgi:enoyl-CoA hydratase/carnithine racemase
VPVLRISTRMVRLPQFLPLGGWVNGRRPQLSGLAKARYHLLTEKSLFEAEAERIGLRADALPAAVPEAIESAFEVARALAARDKRRATFNLGS